MSKLYDRGAAIRTFIVENVDAHPADIAKLTAVKFGCSRQAINQHLKVLTDDGSLVAVGRTRNKTYKLAPQVSWSRHYDIAPSLGESQVWLADIVPVLGTVPDNVYAIWHYAFTEMFNNAIEHSEGRHVGVSLNKWASSTEIRIWDDGVGIFRKIQNALGLADERHAVLELAKGRFTTDPKHHSGEGIFFTSRMFDDFAILSGGVYFSHEFATPEDWILQSENPSEGTAVRMSLTNHTSRTTQRVFAEFTTSDDYAFSRTVVPVRLAQYGDDNLISRSQAKRLLGGVDRFEVVLLDFTEVAMIGQAFADEIFRVFVRAHPEMVITEINANGEVTKMISRARVHGAQEEQERPRGSAT